jgi:hypothetical protein
MTYSLDMGFPQYHTNFMKMQPQVYGPLIEENDRELHAVLTWYNMDILSLFRALAIT